MGEKNFKFDKVLCRKFGKRVSYIRIEKSMRQDELAFYANISQSYMSAIERGITDTTISTAKRISKALKIDLCELFKF